MTNDNKYNGWKNYETWRIKLEFFDDYIYARDKEERQTIAAILTGGEAMELLEANKTDEWDKAIDKRRDFIERLKEEVDDFIEAKVTNGFVHGWATAFANEADYQEIAEALIEEARGYDE